jgi:hypothetical protein
MRKTMLKSLFTILFLGGITMMIFTECKKPDTEITAIIKVKAQWDTLISIPFADVVIGKDFDDVKVEGKTDASGEFRTTFKLEAILDVVASIDTNTGSGPHEPDLTGVAVIRLKPGDAATKTVFIR